MNRHIPVLILSLILLCSCGSNDEPAPGPQPELSLDPNKTYISFKMAMRGEGSRSRGVNPGASQGNWWTIDPSKPSTDMESKISMPLYATIYDKVDNGSGMRALARVSGLQMAGETIYGVLSLNSGINITDLTNNNVRLMLYVNAGTRSDNLFNATLGNLGSGIGSETFSSYGTEAQVSQIPAWGVISLDRPAIAKGKCLHFGTVKLLRAMAKVRVEFKLPAEQAAATTFNSVTVENMCGSGRLVPNDWWHRWSTEDTRHDAMYETGSQNVSASYNAANNVVEFYLPEFSNPRAGNAEMKLNISYTVSGQQRNAAIFLREYDANGKVTDKVYNIVRNNYYHYEVTSVSVDKIKLTAYVNDWAWRGPLGSEIIF